MIILGITDPFCQDNGACILVDGKLIAMIEEERLRRIKHAPFMPPDMAVEYCLKAANKTLEDVDYIAVGFNDPGTILKRNLVKKVKDEINHTIEIQYLKALMESTQNDLDKAGMISGLSKPRLYALIKKHNISRK